MKTASFRWGRQVLPNSIKISSILIAFKGYAKLTLLEVYAWLHYICTALGDKLTYTMSSQHSMHWLDVIPLTTKLEALNESYPQYFVSDQIIHNLNSSKLTEAWCRRQKHSWWSASSQQKAWKYLTKLLRLIAFNGNALKMNFERIPFTSLNTRKYKEYVFNSSCGYKSRLEMTP